MKRKTLIAVCTAVLAGAVFARALRWRRNPSACPYRGGRLALRMPRPLITRERLREILSPRPGEWILEVGPGTGYYALSVAGWISLGGTLEILDIQQEMLDHTMRWARELGLTNIVPTLGDARKLPYPDARFDAAYLVATLGEIPDQEAALRELRRVLKPGGRLIMGESFPDLHMVTPDTLRSRAEAAGFTFEELSGRKFAYFARFRAPL